MEASFLIGMAVVPLPWYKKVLPTALTVSRAYATIIILVLFEYGWYLTGLGVLVAAEATDGQGAQDGRGHLQFHPCLSGFDMHHLSVD